MNHRRVQWISGVLVCQFLVALVVCANPSHKSLDAPLAAHGTDSSAPWYREASSVYESARKNLTEFLEKEQNDAMKSVKAESLGKTHVLVTMMGRGGAWLQIWGEPSGVDFAFRTEIMHSHLSRLIETSKAFPATQKYIANFRQYIATSAPGRAKALGNIEKLCNEKKWPAAEQLLFKVYDTLAVGTVFLTPPENEAIYRPFSQVDQAISEAMQDLRSVTADQELMKSIRELTPDFSALQQEIQAAIDSVGATGSATWRGEASSGPQLVEKIANAWREAQVRSHQCRGKTWALAFRAGNQPNSAGLDPINTEGTDKITAPFAAFSDEVMKALVRLVEVDAARAPADSARNLYVDYLRAFAVLVRQANRPQWTAQLETALAKLQSKTPELDQEVKNYAAATADLLRWRARAAAAQTAGKIAEYAPVEDRFHAGTMSGKVNGMDYMGLFPPQETGTTQPQLLTNAADIMPVAVQRLVGQKTSVRDVVRIAPDSKAAIARYSRRTYANLPAPFELAADIAALKSDLMVSDQAPPLTLAAMSAVVTAERGDLRAAGGTISGAYLEGVVTRFATLPASAVVLTELGQLPAERFDGGNLQNMLMRFDLTPQWVSHDHFFVNLVPPANLTAAQIRSKIVAIP